MCYPSAQIQLVQIQLVIQLASARFERANSTSHTKLNFNINELVIFTNLIISGQRLTIYY